VISAPRRQEPILSAKGTFLSYRDEAGRYCDFYALRHTFVTNLAAGNVHPKTAQTLARHSTITLTMDRYSHTYRGEAAAALNVLPDLSSPARQSQAMAATGTEGAAKTPDPRLARFLALFGQQSGNGRSQGRLVNENTGHSQSPVKTGENHTSTANAPGGNRTHTTLRSRDFKSPASAFPPRGPLARDYDTTPAAATTAHARSPHSDRRS